MRLRCSSKKDSFNNLTVGTEYEAIEEGDIYIVTNNAGLRSRYAKRYFTVVPQAPITRNLLDELTVVIDEGENTITITLNRTERVALFSASRTDCSCGVIDFSGIFELKSVVNQMYANKIPAIVGTKTEMFTRIMNDLINHLRTHNPGFVYLISDQDKTTDTELDEVLTGLSMSTWNGINPNSNHNITLWMISGRP